MRKVTISHCFSGIACLAVWESSEANTVQKHGAIILSTLPLAPFSAFFAAWYPNHVWSVDTTTVMCWGLWPIQVLVAIDHFSRKVVCIVPLEGPNAGWIIEALECAMQKHAAPKYIISDQASVFVGDAL